MSAGFHARKWSRQEADDLPAPRRISTPAGMRLSVIMKDIETGQPAPVSPVSPKIGNRPPQLTFNKETTTVRVVEEEDEDAESIQKESQSAKTSSTPRAYATSLFSVDSEPAAHVVEEKQKDPKKAPLIAMSIAGRRKCIIFSVVAFLMAFSLIVGLAVGFSHKKSSTKTASATTTSPSTVGAASPVSSVILSTPVTLPKDFPLGTYSLYTFLDTVTTTCTSNPATWNCAPGTIYNDNAAGSLATFPFKISGSPGSYTVAPSGTSDEVNDLSFTSVPLSLVDSGKDSERYTFRLNYDRAVQTTLDGNAATCIYNGTSFTGVLYTKTAKDYPVAGQTLPSSGGQTWPFAMRFEKSISGGANTPNCYKKDTTTPITNGITAQPVDAPCSCLYRNWKTPSPY